MGNSLSDIGLSGLLANQRALATTGNNIANANTDGYSRQSVERSAQLPQQTGSGAIGGGVRVDGVSRQIDRFAESQLTATTSASAREDRLSSLLGQLGEAVGGTEGALGKSIDRFFNSAQELANDPSSNVARQVVLDDAQGLANQFNQVDARLQELRRGANDELRAEIGAVNQRAGQIAELNQRIESTRVNGSEPNELLDERRRLVNEIAQRVSVETIEQDNGGLNVAIASTGQSLVTGTNTNELSLAEGGIQPGRPRVELGSAAGKTDVTGQVNGGRIGALLSFRDGALSDAEASIGRIAVGVAERVNEQNSLGLDATGNFGSELFTSLASSTPQVRADSGNSGSNNVSAGIETPGDLEASAYRIEKTGGASFELTRLSDGDSQSFTSSQLNSGVTTDGVRFESTSPGSIDVGDRFRIEPVQSGAAGIGVEASRPGDIATAAPVRVKPSDTNTGDASLTQPVNDSTQNLPPSSGISLTYDGSSQEFNISGDATGTLPYDPNADSGKTFELFSNTGSSGNLEFEISGTPDDGDTFQLVRNDNASGDNRNISELAGIAEERVFGGETSLNGAFAQTTGDIGARGQRAERAAEVQSARLDTARSQRESVSGVNLDEEAAKLVQLQQSFQASARVVSVADEAMQTLLRVTGG